MTTMKEYEATCRTDDCQNAGISIPFTAPDGVVFVCGPCGQEITDVVTR